MDNRSRLQEGNVVKDDTMDAGSAHEAPAAIVSNSESRLEACTRAALARPNECCLFLDMDGTLLDLAATPHTIRVPEGLVGLLERLADGLGGALAIITGRRIAELDLVLSPLRVAASGVHGAEMRFKADGEVEQLMPELSEEIVQSLTRFARRTPGAFAEPKGPGLAIHYRLAPAAGPVIAAELARFRERHVGEFEIWPGQKVFEVIPAGFSKGTAVAALAATAPFRGRVPIMIGDDIGDLPAFAAAERLNGFGLRVASENFGTKGADFDGPRSVRAWLAGLAERLV